VEPAGASIFLTPVPDRFLNVYT